jgi:hypothetical protein
LFFLFSFGSSFNTDFRIVSVLFFELLKE